MQSRASEQESKLKINEKRKEIGSSCQRGYRGTRWILTLLSLISTVENYLQSKRNHIRWRSSHFPTGSVSPCIWCLGKKMGHPVQPINSKCNIVRIH